ncbi:olfactory receptor 10A6-like [Chanos chanos]|uniref:Olfactory receptor 10A6-like n=1 Tax=Chanos chanos TaxID=29144 RepID=A0A6J2VP43_CHACN|nr:olfactory receptor 10A6-like [Chanos chanos]
MNLSDSNITLILSAYGSPGPLSYGFFFVTLVLYLTTVFSNLTLMLVISLDSRLHKPMYIFLFNLAINGLMGSTSVCPTILQYLLEDLSTISFTGCLLQSFFINVYGTCVYAILTAMAYDRYVSICNPLQYHSILTPTKVRLLLGAVYIFPVCSLIVQVYLTSRLPICKYTINKLFCVSLAVVNLACVKTALDSMYALALLFIFGFLPLFLVILSYIKILTVSIKASESAQMKALKTCAPHLITFINFSLATLSSVIYTSFNDYLSNEMSILLSIYFILVPPLLHPLIYGMRTDEIKRSIVNILRRKVFALSFLE